MPPDLSADGHHIDALLRVTLWITGAVGVAFVAALAVVVWRARRRRSDSPVGSAPPVTLGVALAVFALIDLGLAARSRRDTAGPPPPDALRVEVLAQQWAWRFRYAGPDGLFGTDDDVTTVNDLRLPVGRAVSLQVRSLDVAHGLFVPALRARVDAWPGRTGRGWFRPAREGDAELACATLCGTNHYQMRARVTVLSAEGYTRWMDGLLDDQRRIDDAAGAARTTRWGWPWQR